MTLAHAEQALAERLSAYGQEHVLRWWPELDAAGRERFAGQLEALDLDLVRRLVETLVLDGAVEPRFESITSVPVVRLPQTGEDHAHRRRAADAGEEVLAAGEVGVVLVAGGQGTRLGFEGPKGTYPIGPVSERSLFQIHAEKVASLSRRYGSSIPLYVMTSSVNDAVTRAFFEAHRDFGLEHARFFVQGELPAVDRYDGRMLLAAKDSLALSPDGHGGVLAALEAHGCLEEMASLGVRTIFYLQVDNPLVDIGEPAYLGLHRAADADMSFKVVEKQGPGEKVGVVVEADGQARVIEYSDLPPELAERRRSDGGLDLWAGSIATHVFERQFVERLLAGGADLPYHRALKPVDYVDERGAIVGPDEPNAVKFEKFVFDALPLARRFAVVEADRFTEFEPLKNATGEHSPDTVRGRLTELYARWLESAGATVARGEDGSVPFPIEISPLYALDAEELATKIDPSLVVDGPLLLQ